MAATKKEKTITKLYPPQISKYQNQLLIYSPLEHWLQIHSSTSLKDLIEIEVDNSPYFLNRSDEKIVLQSQFALMSQQLDSQNLTKIAQIYEHSHAFASETVYLNHQYHINLDQEGTLNLLPLNTLQSNPQSFKEISTKAQIQFGSFQNLDSAINMETICKKHQNGLNLAHLTVNNKQVFTLHFFKPQDESYTKIYKTEFNQAECTTNSLRAYLPSTLTGLLADGNSIWAYGSHNLQLIDVRSESIVSEMNDILESEISYVKKHSQNGNLLYVCRDTSVLLQDARKTSQIVQVVLNAEQKIELFDMIKEDSKEIFCVSSAFDGKVHFYQTNQVQI